MAIRISAAHRDALYEDLLDQFSGIGDLWTVIEREDFDTATRLGRNFSDNLRLILADLGWGDGPGRSVELTAPPEVLERVFSRLRDTAASVRASEEPEWAAARDREERNRLVAEVCATVLENLEDG
jgi:hypothetical protein